MATIPLKQIDEQQAAIIDTQEGALTGFDRLLAKYALGVSGAPTTEIFRAAKLGYAGLTGGEKKTPEELNTLYPNMTNPFDAPMNEEQAALVREHDNNLKNTKRLLERGSEYSSWIGDLGGFIAETAPYALDPIFWAGAKGVEVGIVKALGTSARFVNSGAGKLLLSQTEKGAALSKSGRVAENFITNLATDAAIKYPLSQIERQDYSTADMLTNAVVGGFVMPALLGHGLPSVGAGISKLVKYANEGAFGRVVNFTEHQLDNNMRPDTTHLDDAMDGIIPPEKMPEVRAKTNDKFKNHMDYDPKYDYPTNDSAAVNMKSEIDLEIEKHAENFKSYEANGMIDAESKLELEEIGRLKSASSKYKTLARLAKLCGDTP